MSNIKNPKIDLLRDALDRVISGNAHVKSQIIKAILADGHILITSVPGTGKTTLVTALQWAVEGALSGTMQLTPDIKPSDILGAQVWDRLNNCFVVVPGPIVGKNIFLADEINRTPGKTLSAILRPMQERIVTIGGQDFPQPELSLLIATRNPIEQEGTYPLPEAAIDRFSVEVTMDYVAREDEVKMLRNSKVYGRQARDLVKPVISVEELLAARVQVMDISDNASDSSLEYISDIVRATRPQQKRNFEAVHGDDASNLNDAIKLGASPRAGIAILRFAAANAYLDDRDAISPDDIKTVARDVLRHRIILNPAVVNEMTPDDVISKVLDRVKPVEVRSKK
jgi:MoxR-like ATPase